MAGSRKHGMVIPIIERLLQSTIRGSAGGWGGDQGDLKIDPLRGAKPVVPEQLGDVEHAQATDCQQPAQGLRTAPMQFAMVQEKLDRVVSNQLVAAVKQAEDDVAFAGAAVAGQQQSAAGDGKQRSGDGGDGIGGHGQLERAASQASRFWKMASGSMG